MNSLIEKVAKAIYEWQPSMDWNDVLEIPSHVSTKLHKVHYEMMAKNAIAAVLDHFSNPENVTPAMLNALDDAWLGLVDSEPRSVCIHAAIAAAMKAAKEESE